MADSDTNDNSAAGLPDSITRIPFFDSTEDTDTRQSFFEEGSLKDESSRQPFFDLESMADYGPLDRQLEQNQAAQKKITDWLSTFHGAEPQTAGSLRQQVESGKISGSDFFAMTGRIHAGGTGDIAQRDARGNITGYKSRDGSGRALSGPSGTPGLEAFHEMNPAAPSGKTFSFLPEKTQAVPQSVAKSVTPPSSEVMGPPPSVGPFADRRIQTPFGSASVNFSGAMNKGQQLPAALPKKPLNVVA